MRYILLIILLVSLLVVGCAEPTITSVDTPEPATCSDGIHTVGESWEADDGCNTCSCDSDGHILCTEIACVNMRFV
jgi:hypothetical protein